MVQTVVEIAENKMLFVYFPLGSHLTLNLRSMSLELKRQKKCCSFPLNDSMRRESVSTFDIRDCSLMSYKN